MEITVNIPKNDYVRPTEVRQEVVHTFVMRFSALASGAYFTQKDKARTGARLYTLEFINEVVRPTDLATTKHLTVTLISDLMARK